MNKLLNNVDIFYLNKKKSGRFSGLVISRTHAFKIFHFVNLSFSPSSMSLSGNKMTQARKGVNSIVLSLFLESKVTFPEAP